MWVQPNTSVARAIARGQWQAPLGSSRGRPPDHGQPAAVLASVKDEPSAALNKRRPGPPLRATAPARCGRDGRMLAARVEQKKGVTTRHKNGVMHPRQRKPHTSRMPELGPY